MEEVKHERDLIFLSGKFSALEIPKDKKYLLKYFTTPIEKELVKYFFSFGSFDNFTDHTGHFCQVRWLKILRKRLDDLEKVHGETKEQVQTAVTVEEQEAAMSYLRDIEAGKYKEFSTIGG